MKATALILCAAVLTSCGAPTDTQPGTEETAIAIVGATLIDGTGAAPVDDAVVVVSGERITAAGPRASVQVPEGATVVQAAGKTVMPGLIDVHCHLNQPADIMRKLLPVALNWGVTTLRMTGNDKPEIMQVYHDANAGEFLAPRVFSAGQGFNLTGPYPGAPTFKPKTAEEARANVRQTKELGAQFVKIWMSDEGFPPEIVAAIVDEAKTQNLKIVAHIGNVAQVRQLAEQGVTDFLHTVRDGLTPEFMAYAKEKNLSFAPTIANGESRYYYLEHPEFLKMDPKFDGWYARGRAMLTDSAFREKTLVADAEQVAARKERIKQQLAWVKTMIDNGVRVVTGTDCGAESAQTTPVGHATHREVQLYVEGGVAPLLAIKAGTLDAARALERTENPDYGSIQAGKIADLVVLDADPTADIHNTNKVGRVMRAGRWVE